MTPDIATRIDMARKIVLDVYCRRDMPIEASAHMADAVLALRKAEEAVKAVRE